MATSPYGIGDLAELRISFTNPAGAQADPSTVALLVQSPDGTQHLYTFPADIVRLSVGVFSYELNLTQSGLYLFRWTGTGAVQVVQEGSLSVNPTILVPPLLLDLCSLEQVKDWLAIKADNTAADALLSRLITAAGMHWLIATGRLPADGSVPMVSPLVQLCDFNEWYDGSGSERQFVKNPPVTSIIAVVNNGVSLAPSLSVSTPGYVIADNGSSIAIRQGGIGQGVYRRVGWLGVFASGVQNINLQYRGGYSVTPPDITQACIEMVGLTFRKRQWIGQASQALAAGGGTVSYRNWVIEPSVQRVINNYSRKAIV